MPKPSKKGKKRTNESIDSEPPAKQFRAKCDLLIQIYDRLGIGKEPDTTIKASLWDALTVCYAQELKIKIGTAKEKRELTEKLQNSYKNKK